MKTKKKTTYKISPFKCLVVFNFLLASVLLVHDFIFWGIIPMFTGQFYQLTYLGLFIDISTILLVDVSIQCFKEWIS